MEKEPTIDQETCCSSQLESEFSLFGSTSLDQSNRTSKHCSQDFAEFGGRRKKRNIGFGTETQRFMLPALPCSTVGPGTYSSDIKWLPCENIAIGRKAAPFNSTQPKPTNLNLKDLGPGPGTYWRASSDSSEDRPKVCFAGLMRSKNELHRPIPETVTPGPCDYSPKLYQIGAPSFHRVFQGPPKLPEPVLSCSTQIDYAPIQQSKPPSLKQQQRPKQDRRQLKNLVEGFLKDLYEQPDPTELENIQSKPSFFKNTNSFVAKIPNPYNSYIPRLNSPAPGDYNPPLKLTAKKRTQQLSVFKSQVPRELVMPDIVS